MLVHVIMKGTPAENLATVWAAIKQKYKELGIDRTKRFGDLKMTMFAKVLEVSLIEFEGGGEGVVQGPVQNMKFLIRKPSKYIYIYMPVQN